MSRTASAALTMHDVDDAVGVRAPSLYKRVRGRSDLFRLILEDVADELSSALDAAASSGDPAADVRAMTAARTIVAWAHGVITMELAGAFRLGGDVEQAWDFGLDRMLAAVRAASGTR